MLQFSILLAPSPLFSTGTQRMENLPNLALEAETPGNPAGKVVGGCTGVLNGHLRIGTKAHCALRQGDSSGSCFSFLPSFQNHRNTWACLPWVPSSSPGWAYTCLSEANTQGRERPVSKGGIRACRVPRSFLLFCLSSVFRGFCFAAMRGFFLLFFSCWSWFFLAQGLRVD